MFYSLLNDWHSHLISFDFNFGGNTQFKGTFLNWIIPVILYKSTTLRKYINPDTKLRNVTSALFICQK